MIAADATFLDASAPLTSQSRVQAAERVGAGPNQSMVYIDFGPRSFAFDVRYHGSITGFAALELIDQDTSLEMESIAFGAGRFVTGVSYRGYHHSGTGSGGNDYWSYWLGDIDGDWSYSGTGASFRVLHPGESDGWVWTALQQAPPDLPNLSTQPHVSSAVTPEAYESRSIPESSGLVSVLLFRGRRRKAFSLVELLVIIGIIAILIAMILPAMKRASEQSRSVNCLSNLRQMMIAATNYQAQFSGRFPIASYSDIRPGVAITYNWDYVETRNLATGQRSIEPGLLWNGQTSLGVQQCPSFDGKSIGFLGDPFTGYNYNTSYIGREMAGGVMVAPPTRASQIRKPAQTAVFGDGQYAVGANKFMRSPFYAPYEPHVARYAGTQGFRHRGRTNVAFADGHADSLADRFTQTLPADASRLAVHTGFLSPDNSMYDLD